MIPKIFLTYQRLSSDRAQQIFEDWIRNNSKVVYGLKDTWVIEWQPDIYSTHQALLICIEEIEKKECEHRGIHHKTRDASEGYHCILCGKDLKNPNWEAIE
jgi:hypothetical protein